MKRKLVSLFLAASLAVLYTPAVPLAIAEEASEPITYGTTTSSDIAPDKTYSVSLNDWTVSKVGESVSAQLDSTGIILNPGERLVWTSTGEKSKWLTGMMDHHNDDNWQYLYSAGVGFKIVKSNDEGYDLDSVCSIQKKDYQIISGGQTVFGADGKITNATDKLIYSAEEKDPDGEEGLTLATVNVDDSMTANVPIRVKAANSGELGVYYSRCSIHTTCNWNAYYYGVGRILTVEPLVSTADDKATASVEINLDGGTQASGTNPTSVTFGNESFDLNLSTPIKSGSTFVGWEVTDENGDNRPFRNVLEEDENGTLYYPGLTATNWNNVKNAIGETIYIKAIWTSSSSIPVTLDGNGGIVKAVKESTKSYIIAKDTFRPDEQFEDWYIGVRPGYTFKGWYLEGYKLQNITNIPARLWDPNNGCTVKAQWERNSAQTECFTLDSATKKLTVLNSDFFRFSDDTYTWQDCWQQSIKELDITKQITEIPDGAFIGFRALTSVVIPKSVTAIGSQAFDIDALEQVFVSSSVTTLASDSNTVFGDSPNGSVTIFCDSGSAVESYAQERNARLDESEYRYTIQNLTYSNLGRIEPSCTEDGYEGYKKCNECDAFSEPGAVIPATGHSWDTGSVKTPATETAPGVMTHACTKCPETEEVEIPATGHVWNKGVVTKAASATETGIMTYTCTNAGCGATTTAVIPVTGHVHTWNSYVETKAATATETGVKIRSCSSCSATETAVIPATGTTHEHSWDTGVITKEPTEAEEGIRTFTCTVEGCGETKTEPIEKIAHVHSWDSGKVTKEPTATEPGVKTFTCTKQGCGAMKTESIPATGGTAPGTGGSTGGGSTPAPQPEKSPITNAGSGDSTSATVDVTDKVTTTESGSTQVAVDAELGNKIVENAVANKVADVVIKAETSEGSSSASTVALPASTVKELAEKTEASVTISTDSAQITLDSTAVAAVAEQAGEAGSVQLVVKTSEQNKNKVQIEVTLQTSNGTVSDFRGGSVRISVPVSEELAAKKIVCVYIDANGKYTKMPGALSADGKSYVFSTGHFSTYAVMSEEEADTAIAEQEKAEAEALAKAEAAAIAAAKPGTPSVKLSSPAKGKLTVKASAKKAKGYRVYYKKAGWKAYKTFTTTGTVKSLSKTFKKLSKGSYTVKVRAFGKTAAGKTVWGAKSKAKKVSVK